MMVPAIAFVWWFAATPVQDHSMVDMMLATPSLDGAVPGDQSAERLKVKRVTRAMAKAAGKYVKLPMGTERYATVDGKRYVFVLEQHYHPPGFVGAPNGWHKGVTMYELRYSESR